MKRELFDLKLCLVNDLRGLTIEPMTDYDGFFLVGPDGWTQYCVYVSQEPQKYSVYIAIPDIRHGFDISDEKELCAKAPLFTAVSKIKTHHMMHGGSGLYSDSFIAPNSVTDYQRFMRHTYGRKS